MAVPQRPRRLLRLRPFDRRGERRHVDEEIRLHLELRVAQLVADGMDPAAAEEEARRRFARHVATLRDLYDTAHERNRRMRLADRLEGWWMDIRYAARGLLRDRLVSAFVVVALAIGMGSLVSSFSLADQLLLRPPRHVVAPAALTRVVARLPENGGLPTATAWVQNGTYEAMRNRMPPFERMAAYRPFQAGVGSGAAGRMRRVATERDGFMAMLGVRPILGRLFERGEDAAVTGRLAVINERVWRENFGASRDVLGATLRVGEEPHTVVGVVPEGFAGIERQRVDVWTLAHSGEVGWTNWQAIGRLSPGADTAAVTAAAGAAHARSVEDVQQWFRPAVLSAASIRVNGDLEEPFEGTMARWLTVISVVILLVALGNVLNLVLARMARRQRELGVRVALGSGMGRLVRMLALEGVLLAGAAGLLALWVVRLLEPALRGALMGDTAAWDLTLLDGRLLAALLATVAGTAVIVGVLPSVRLRGAGLGNALRGGRLVGGRREGGVRTALTVLQAALSVVLLVGAGLFLHSMNEVRRLDLGVDRDRLTLINAELPPMQEERPPFAARLAYEVDSFERIAAEVRRIPQVEAASVAIGVPLDGGTFGSGVHVPGRDSVPSLPGGGPYVSAVSAEYFTTVGTNLLHGRPFEAADRAGAEPVLIVNETMARYLWPGQNALEKCVRVGSADAPCARVVGVAEDVHRVGLREMAAFQVYLPIHQQTMFGGSTLLVRSAAGATPPAQALRDAVTAAVPGLGLMQAAPLNASLQEELRPLRLGIMAFGMSSLLALVVAVLGLYSVMTYTVAWRTRELGVRAALGATGSQINRMVVGQGLLMAGGGVLLGLILALVGGRYVAEQLFQTSTTDPVVLGGVAVLLMAVAALAGWLPARRAARISPTEALRAD